MQFKLITLDPCQQPQVIGSCNEQSLRFYYDNSLRQCQPFMYSGCDGNDNNFPSLNECSQTCGKFVGAVKKQYNVFIFLYRLSTE